ncbi:succinylglutamate desuccinylase/aspartoacylase domain-containing protein [Rhodohalobacter barkolensis]|uniref:Aspartoacylase n=1 Tax=Rhodohalobacter barkolensis TaxID=2053187 RepID=A0A2N0VF60_9BACT|nr:succinylglutamate desuccinylase/aspartoacylase family protein [Rhodohalobacter barkolensis]PKD42778.1 aspartoacylase [Rhodohalobacter barkolensis]
MIQDTETLKSNAIGSKRIQHVGSDSSEGPIVVLFVGLHGNETAGVKAVDRVIGSLLKESHIVNGSLYAITGNMEALSQGVRYVDTDLNRLWEKFNTEQDFSLSNQQNESTPVEHLESLSIKSAIEDILSKHNQHHQEIIFADLHTTSSESCAFILLNDTLANRSVARKFPVPQILGIEESIHGTLLSYINNLGYRAIGFEAGAHTSRNSVIRSEAFIMLLLHYNDMIKLEETELSEYETKIRAYSDVPDTYFDIRYHHIIDDSETFSMMPGFKNFDPVDIGTPLAYHDNKLVKAPETGRIFMPLYQKRGNDGFLIIKKVSPFWLTLSAWLRQSFIHSILKFLPGVRKVDHQTFEINRDVAMFLVKKIFHLLGYRVTEKDSSTFVCYRR